MKQDILDKFLKEVSYKFPKGYPDMEDPKDVEFLNKLVMEHTNESKEYKVLKFGDLKKKDGARLEKVANLINSEHPFVMVGGEEKPLKFDLDTYAQLFSQRNVAGVKQLATNINKFPLFKDKEGNKYTIEDLLKSPEIGGKGKGYGTEKEDLEIQSLNNQIQSILQQENTDSISVVLNGVTYKGITHAIQSPHKHSKADCALNAGNESLIFLSLKDGSKPSDIQQYGGFSILKDSEEAQAFVQAVSEKTGGTLQPKQSYARPIQDENIKLKSVYGKDQQDGDYGWNNCQAVMQGRLTLTKTGSGVYTLTATHMEFNPKAPTGEYEPYFMVTYRGDRTSEEVQDARFGVYPKGFKSKLNII